MTESGATEMNDDGTRSTLRAALTSVARDAGSSIGAVHPDMPSAESHVTNQCSLLSTRVSLPAPALVHSTAERPQKHTQCEARLFVCVNGYSAHWNDAQRFGRSGSDTVSSASQQSTD